MSYHKHFRRNTEEYKNELKEILNPPVQKSQPSLQKMSRPRIVFPKLEGVTNRPDQEVRLLENDRQKKIYGKQVASAEFRDRPEKLERPTRFSGSRKPINTRKELIDTYGDRVANKFGTSVLGLNHQTPQGPKSAALAGKLRSKFEEGDDQYAQKLEDHKAKVQEAKRQHVEKLQQWKDQANSLPSGSTEYWNHIANKPKFKSPRRPSKTLKDTAELGPEQMKARGRAVEATIEHEGLHHVLDRVEQKYGPVATSRITQSLLQEHHPKAMEAVRQYISKHHNYNPRSDSFNEELLAHARDLLVNPKKRENFKNFLTNSMHGRVIDMENKDREGVFKEIIGHLKRGHQKAYEKARQIELKDIRPDLVPASGEKLAASEEMKKAPYEFTAGEGSAFDGVLGPSPQQSLIHSETLPNGLKHEVHSATNSLGTKTYTHILTHSKHGPVASMRTRPAERGSEVQKVDSVSTAREHRGQGFGTSLYTAALSFHNRLASDGVVSRTAEKMHGKLSKLPGVESNYEAVPYRDVKGQTLRGPKNADPSQKYLHSIKDRRAFDEALSGPKKMAASEMAKSEAADKETEKIKQNKKTAEAKKPHRFKPARWTHPNGHPRCILCGDEERIGGTCEGASDE